MARRGDGTRPTPGELRALAAAFLNVRVGELLPHPGRRCQQLERLSNAVSGPLSLLQRP
jgi:hypothetical protein